MAPPLLPNTDFGNVALWTTELAYLAFNQVFDGQTQYLGHQPKLTDASLDPTGNNILARVDGIVSPFLVTQVGTSGSVITWSSGQYRTATGNVITIPSAQLSLPADSTNYIYISGTGTVTNSTASTDVAAYAGVPVIRHILAKVVVVASNISSISDLRSLGIRTANPPAQVIRTFGGQSTTDFVVTAGQVLTGTIYCRNFTVPAGISCTITYYCKIVCSGTFTNNGTITVTKIPYGAPSLQMFLSKSGNSGQLPGTGLGTRGNAYNPSVQANSSGGSQGTAILPNETSLTLGYVVLGQGGDAGGSLIVEAFGQITQNGSIFADGGNAIPNTNAYTNADSSVGTGKCLSSGSGGGAGGLVNLTSLTGITCTATSVTSVKGGNGGDALINTTSTSPYFALGGHGAGGGYILLNTPGILSTTGASFVLTGGVPGANANYLSGLTTVSSGSYRSLNTTYGIYTAGTGAGFGGNSGTIFNTSSDATYSYFSISNGTAGQLITSTALPIS
jgi:hypothetical protein